MGIRSFKDAFEYEKEKAVRIQTKSSISGNYERAGPRRVEKVKYQ